MTGISVLPDTDVRKWRPQNKQKWNIYAILLGKKGENCKCDKAE